MNDLPASTIATYVFHNSPLKVWGLTPKDRWQRLIKPVGGAEIHMADDQNHLAEDFARLPAVPDKVLLMNGEYIIDQVTFDALVGRPNTVLIAQEETGFVIVAAYLKDCSFEALQALLLKIDIDLGQHGEMRFCQAVEIAQQYHQKLRKKYVPYVLKVGRVPKNKIEKVMFDGSYKGVTDIVTKYIWPPIALPLTRLSAFLRLTPNNVTSIGFLLMLLATWLFYKGLFAEGLIAGWIMTLLDTVDGKLARVTLTSSRLGNSFDHGIDLIHPPFWWWAWWYGVLNVYQLNFPWVGADLLLFCILSGYLVQRLIEGYFVRVFGMHIHVWQRADSFFRLITARRNPNLLILTAFMIFDRPEWGLVWVGIWTVFSLLFHLVRLVQAQLAKNKKNPLSSWLTE